MPMNDPPITILRGTLYNTQVLVTVYSDRGEIAFRDSDRETWSEPFILTRLETT